MRIYIKKLITLTCFLYLSPAAKAQRDTLIEGMIRRVAVNCQDVIYSAHILLPELHAAGKRDTMHRFLAYSRKICDELDLVRPFEILSAIEEGNFSENIYASERSLYFLRWFGMIIYGWQTTEGQKAYDEYVKKWAKTLSEKKGISTVEKFLVNYYAAPDAERLELLKSAEFAGTTLQMLYNKDKKDHRQFPTLYGEGLFNMWVPTGNLSLLGAHPGFAVEAGVVIDRVAIGLNVAFYFLKSANSYYVLDEGTLYTTDYFFGGYIGVNGAYDILRSKKQKMCALAGLAYDGFDVLYIKREPEPNSKSVGSFNFNIGIGYRYKVLKKSYIGINVKYNHVNYQNLGGTDLSGRTFTFGVCYGGY